MNEKARGATRVILGVLVTLGSLPGGSGGQVVAIPGVVRGRVVEFETDGPLRGVAVQLSTMIDGELSTVTQLSGPGGDFAFPGVRPGVYVLTAAMLGYGGLTDTLRVEPGSVTEMLVPISVSAVELEPVVVMVRQRPVGPLRGFERRRELEAGIFMDREDLDDADVKEFTDLLRNVPGVRMVPTASFGYRVRFRGGCVPELWLDGTLVGMNVDIDSFLRIDDLEAVEIYRGTEVPGEFGANLCGAIVAWTRRGGATPPGESRSIVRQLVYAASFLALVFLIR